MNLLQKKQNSNIKNLEENFMCTSGHSMFAHKFLGKRNILCGKNNPKCSINAHIKASKFVSLRGT
jgi:hypothetical protein